MVSMLPSFGSNLVPDSVCRHASLLVGSLPCQRAWPARRAGLAAQLAVPACLARPRCCSGRDVRRPNAFRGLYRMSQDAPFPSVRTSACQLLDGGAPVIKILVCGGA